MIVWCHLCSFEEHFPVNRVKLGAGERQIVLVGGKPCIEDGPLSHFVGELPELLAPQCWAS